MRLPSTTLLFAFAMASAAQTPKNLAGLHYRGTSEAKFQEGCEGCGNPVHVEFREDGDVDLSLPGSDTPGSMRYKRTGNTIRLPGSKWRMVLKGDTLYVTAYDYRHI
ncbi:MAG: hypothetical protein IPL52_01530 [Flavobacteriales bacterium]|nr:hypothetical protein [Flavobacteriales bacterium]